MKTFKILYILPIALLITISCEQEVITLEPPAPVVVTPPTGTKGTADFTKFVAIGNSLTAGYQSGALFTEGQQNSLPLIMSKQFSIAQGTAVTFNQPDINSVNGFFGVAGTKVLGRLILFDSDGAGPKTVAPAPAGSAGMPAPYTGGDLPSPYLGDRSKLNNFGVPGILLGQALTPLTGAKPVPPATNPAYNALYERFASNAGVSTILGDAIATQPTFFMFDLGNNDVLGYATGGGSNPAIFTSVANFQAQYGGALATLLGTLPNAKGVVANIPDVTTIPFFLTVAWNAIPLDAATASAVNSGFAGYNQVLDAIKGNAGLMGAFGLTAAGLDARKVTYAASSKNPILISDETLTDLKGAFDALLGAGAITPAQRAGLEPYRKARQTKATDLITLSAGGILGTTVGGNPLAVNGVSIPLADNFVLLPSEIAEVRERTIAFNTIIKGVADANSTRLAYADVNATFTALVTNRVGVYNGVTITPNFAPPTGVFSEDGVHPNSRGYSFMANVFIDAINAKFGATIPKASIADYKGTGLPVSAQ